MAKLKIKFAALHDGYAILVNGLAGQLGNVLPERTGNRKLKEMYIDSAFPDLLHVTIDNVSFIIPVTNFKHLEAE